MSYLVLYPLTEKLSKSALFKLYCCTKCKFTRHLNKRVLPQDQSRTLDLVHKSSTWFSNLKQFFVNIISLETFFVRLRDDFLSFSVRSFCVMSQMVLLKLKMFFCGNNF